MFVSPDILAEIRDVLTRPKTQKKFPPLSPESVNVFVESVESKAVLLTRVPRAETLGRDPKDEPYLNLAIAARAQYLVSRDRDLLDLMEDNGFRKRHPDLMIIDPVAFLDEIAKIEASGKS